MVHVAYGKRQTANVKYGKMQNAKCKMQIAATAK
jgi:hypothetical protein